MDIRPAARGDIPGMIQLLKQVGQVHHRIRPDLFRPGAQKYSEADLEALLKDAAKPIFVAVEEGAVLGYCFCIHRDYLDSPVLTDRRELYIDDLCVEETRRGQGIASALYRHVCGYAGHMGCSYLTLNVWSGNDAAWQFYRSMGLQPRSTTLEARLEDTQC